MERPQNRHLRPNPHTLGVPMTDTEATKVVRVRGEAEAIAWFAALTGAERGKLIEALYEQKNAPT